MTQAASYLRRLARTSLRAEQEGTIDRELVHGPYERLDLQMAALFRAQGQCYVMSAGAGVGAMGDPAYDTEHELVRFLMTERTKVDIRELRTRAADQGDELGAPPAVAIPIFQGDELAAFAVYGIHRDGTKLDPTRLRRWNIYARLARRRRRSPKGLGRRLARERSRHANAAKSFALKRGDLAIASPWVPVSY